MEFEQWEPVYEAVLADFAFDRGADERARDVLAGMTEPFDLGRLSSVGGATVAIAGGGPSLPDELAVASEADVVFAASSAADVCLDAGIEVNAMVTDLDKNPGLAGRLTARGVPVSVHAHGDNVDAVREFVPTFDVAQVLPTTQAAPFDPVLNFGGFTDGDRAAFLADHLGAGRLRFPGWDFDDPAVDDEKRLKLRWAERLLYWLERRRDERFPVLEGRRENVDTQALPID